MLILLACSAPDDDGSALHESVPSDTARPDTAPDSGSDTSPDSGDDTRSGSDSNDSGVPPYDGQPCVSYAAAIATGNVQDPALDELSGLAVSRLNPGILWTHEDSGGAAELYALDTSGATVATLTLDGVENVDWEDIAVGPCGDAWCLVVGDIGTLGTDRSEFALLVVEEPLLDGTPELVAVPEVRPFTYPDAPEDAEALALAADGTPVILSKREDATSGVYVLGEGATVLEWLGDIATGPEGEDLAARVTAADLWPDQQRLLVRTYFHLFELDATDLGALGEPVTLDYAFEIQGEAVAYDPVQGGFWQVSEGVGPALNYTGCAP